MIRKRVSGGSIVSLIDHSINCFPGNYTVLEWIWQIRGVLPHLPGVIGLEISCHRY
jgi:hypothetical protein